MDETLTVSQRFLEAAILMLALALALMLSATGGDGALPF
jgi:hypothetical protein